MVLPTSQNLRAKLTPDVRETEYAARLEKLNSTLRTAYILVRENSHKAHATNKRYYDQKARERSFEPGDIVYLFSPAKKSGQNSKFWTPWAGSYKVVASLSKLNYRIKECEEKSR
jgi:hypothetical protein